MNMQRRDRHVGMAVMIGHQPFRQLPRLVVIDIDQRSDAGTRAVVDLQLFHEARAHEIAHGFRTVLMPARLHILVERAHQFVVDRHGYALQFNAPAGRASVGATNSAERYLITLMRTSNQ
jgi:hypothetical protein